MFETVASQWLACAAVVFVLLALDMVVFHRQARAPGLAESACWTVFWCGVALGFNALVWWWRGSEAGVQFLTGYVVEWSLSMDNVFVFAVIFGVFQVPLKYQYRVLFWGILGAIVMRLSFVLAGTGLLHIFDWVLPTFGLFLVYTAVKLVLRQESDVNPEKNPLLRLARRYLPVTREDHGQQFLVREGGRWCLTPLLLVLLVIESTDVVFAVDSVPAVFGITQDPFIVFSSNIFAILGLRALYFLLAGVIDTFRYLPYGLAGVLGFVGAKMVAEYWIAPPGEHLVSPTVSLAIIVLVLSSSVLASLVIKPRASEIASESLASAPDA